jgi:serine/threonine protein kinase
MGPALFRQIGSLSLALALVAHFAAGAAGAASPPEIRWVVAQRDLDLGDWRARIAGAGGGRSSGGAWIGGGPSSEAAAGNLYRFDGEEWRLAHTLGIPGARTFVLDVDPAGRLWVAPYAKDAGSTYARLEVRRLERGSWQREILVPGLWPQAMAWPSSDEGWIAGNNGLLYHYQGGRRAQDGQQRMQGRWRLETLDLPAAERRDLNLLALRMSSPGAGWAVGSRGLVARYAGGRWTRVPVPPPLLREKLEALDEAADGTLWVAGTHGTLASRDRATGRWRLWPAPVDVELLGLDMIDPIDATDSPDGWAVGLGGTILRFDGTAWRLQPSPTAATFSDVQMSGRAAGWIAGGSVVLQAVSQRAPRFWDRSADFPALSGRGADQLAAIDADEDGDLDLFAVDLEGVHRFENRGDGNLMDRQELHAAGTGEIAPDGVAWGDADGDGRLDMVVVGRRPGGLWLNRQRRRLEFDPPTPLPVAPPGGLHDIPSLIDLDGDGSLDLHLARSSPVISTRMADRAYAGDGAGHWRRLLEATGDRGAERLALWGDLDGDLDLDLLLAASGRELDLWRNDSGRLRRSTRGSGLDAAFDPGEMSQGALWDFDRDGDLDVLLLGRRLYVFRNDGRGRFAPAPGWFEPLASSPALAQSQIAIGDLDLDGWPEVLLSPVAGGRGRVVLLKRGGDGRYRDVAAAAGVRDLAGKAAIFADWDGDGDLDLIAAGARRSYLLANLQIEPTAAGSPATPTARSFLKIRVRSAWGDPLARGAQVRLYEAGRLGDRAALLGFQCVGVGLPGSGASHLSELHFGVPRAGRFDLEVRFLDGRIAGRRGISAGTTLTIHDFPWGVRQAVTAATRLRRAALLADPAREGASFAAALALALVLRGSTARRLGAARISRHPAAPVLLLSVQLGAAVLAIDNRPGWPRAIPLACTGAAALSLLAADRAWTARAGRRGARHLGPYRLLELIGEGGMGAVWRARHLVSRREVALKVLQPQRTADEAHRTRFLREGAILARLDHPNIVHVQETGEIGGRGFISMEMLAGETLATRLRRAGPLAPAQAAAFLAVAAEALAEVHRAGIVHRDVKSDNFFVLGDIGDDAGLPATLADWRARLKLMDFGLAQVRELPTLTAADGLLGTLAYLAPEQLAGQPHDARSDLYALGVVAFEAATGSLPPSPLRRSGDGADTAAELERRLSVFPLPFARLLGGLLAHEPGLRPSSAGEVAGAAEACLGDGNFPQTGPAEREPRSTEDERPASTTERLWQARLVEIRHCLGRGSVAEAQVRLLALIAELRQRIETLAPEERNLYARRYRLGEVLDLERQMRNGFREIP